MKTFPMYIAKLWLVGMQKCTFTRADRNSTFFFRKSCSLALLCFSIYFSAARSRKIVEHKCLDNSWNKVSKPHGPHQSKIPWSVPLVSLSWGWIWPDGWKPISGRIPGANFSGPIPQRCRRFPGQFILLVFLGGWIQPDDGRRILEQIPWNKFSKT